MVKLSSYFLIVSLVVIMVSGCGRAPYKQLDKADDYLRQGQIRKGMEIINKSVGNSSDDPKMYISAAAILFDHKQYLLAASVLEGLLEEKRIKLSAEERAGVLIRIAGCYQEIRKNEKAEKSYKDALALAPDSPELLNALGYFYAVQGYNLDMAVKLTAKAVELAPDKGHIIDSLGWAYYQSGRYEKAVTYLREAVEKMPESAEIRYHLASAYFKTGRKLEASIENGKALALNSTFSEALILSREIHK